jgi:hypothetical protein
MRAAEGRVLVGELVLKEGLSPAHVRAFSSANANVLWGWKRDRGALSRTVFFEARVKMSRGALIGTQLHFFYRTRLPRDEASCVENQLSAAVPALDAHGFGATMSARSRGDMRLVELAVGCPSDGGATLLTRLLRRRPRRSLGVPVLPPALDLHRASSFFPADLYVGSGLAYEAGLPTLCDMHRRFGVDRADGTDFAFGVDDELPGRLARDPVGVLTRFFDVHVGAVCAAPTPAMARLAVLSTAGYAGLTYTDNVDNLLARAGLAFLRVRGSGVLNERFPVEPRHERLIVVGVAADRREIVRQYRREGAAIVVVNPVNKVSPQVRHLDYLRPGDPFFRTTAHNFFAACDAALELGVPGASNPLVLTE